MERLRTKVAVLVLLLSVVFSWCAFCQEEPQISEEEKKTQQQVRMQNPEERAEQMLNRIRASDPEAAERLEKLGREDPEAFHQEIREYMMSRARRMPKSERMGERGGRTSRRGEHFGGGGERLGEMQKKHEEYLEWLKENYPAEAAELEEVKERNPQLYMHQLMRSVKKYGRIAKAATDNPELAEVMKEDVELKDIRSQLLEKIHTAKDPEKDALKKELKDVVAKRFDLIVRRKQIQHKELLEKLERLKKDIVNSEAEVEKWKASKQKKVAERFKELLEKTEKFHWD